MTLNEKLIEDICERVEADLGDGTTEANLARFEHLVLTTPVHPEVDRPLPKKKWLRGMALAAAVLLPVLIGAGFWLRDSPLELRINRQVVSDVANLHIQSGVHDNKQIRFANQSRIVLMQNTDATVRQATDAGVVMRLNRGELYLEVEGKESQSWVVHTGEYRVSVLGTRFYVEWRNAKQILDVRVVNGTVLVEGPHAGKVGIAVNADTHLRLDTAIGYAAINHMSSAFYDASSPTLLHSGQKLQHAWALRAMDLVVPQDEYRPGRREIRPVASPQRDCVPGDRAGCTGRTLPRRSAGRTALKRTSGEQGRSHPGKKMSVKPSAREKNADWQTMLNQRDYLGAIAAVEFAGFNSVLKTASLAELWKLMNAARRANRDELAEQILLTCRHRFPTSKKAPLAAFVLGKVNYYGKGDAGNAVSWFKTYLNEAPTGPLAEEALGRLIVLENERGKTHEAKSLASQYLRRYPKGAFAENCRDLVNAPDTANPTPHSTPTSMP
jgi:ferric-dicitrate binding protein FerR (iron transport regulator)/TolA-binding protein